MHTQLIVKILSFYGIFLITCGITAVTFIGMKAKTALISGSIAGSISLLVAYLVYTGTGGAQPAGIIVSALLLGVFSWRSTKTLFRLFEIIPAGGEEVRGKGIAFLIISLMAVVSVFVLALQIVFY